FWITDPVIKSDQYVSPAYEKVWGRYLKNLDDFIESVLPEDRPLVNAALERQRRGEKTEIEYRIKHRDGSVRWIWDRAFPIFDASGKLKNMAGIATDITKRKHVVDALYASEKRFRALIENSLDDISLLSADGTLLWESPSVIRNLEYDPDEFLGRNILELVHPEDLDQVKNMQADLVQKPAERQNATLRIMRSDGTWRWIEAVATNMLNESSVQAIVLNYRDITERKQVEDALLESEERFKGAFQYSAIGMALVSLEGNWLRVNSKLCSIVGYSEVELLTKTFQDITHPNDLNTDLNYVKQVLAGEINSYTMEKRYLQKDGGIVWVILAVALARDKAGTPLYFISQIEDITERKRVEALARESEERYRSLFEDSPIALWEEDFSAVKNRLEALREQGVTDFNEYFNLHPQAVNECASLVKILDINKATIKLFGAAKKDDLLKSIAELLKDEPIQQFQNELVNIAEGKTIFGWKGVIKTLDQSLRSIDLSWRAVPDDENSLSRVIVSMIDITEGKRAEEALRESEEKYRTIVETMTEGIWVVDKAWITTYVNPAMAAMLGYTETELLGRSPMEFVDLEDAQKASMLMQRREKGVTEKTEVGMRRKDNTTMLAQSTSVSLLNGKGEFAGGLSLVADITERGRMEAALIQSEQAYRTLFENVPVGLYRTT
ncbi:MAG TPA: PAS domain S-box protein, partial [Anaerolineales bacterium]|nr:PAS domain S-box protein [Anaerolineales bacterium]